MPAPIRSAATPKPAMAHAGNEPPVEEATAAAGMGRRVCFAAVVAGGGGGGGGGSAAGDVAVSCASVETVR